MGFFSLFRRDQDHKDDTSPVSKPEEVITEEDLSKLLIITLTDDDFKDFCDDDES